MITDKKEIIERLSKNVKTLDDINKLEIVTNLFNKFGTSWELSEYLESKVMDGKKEGTTNGK
jgi:uncharacterized protein YhfF